MSYCCVQHAYLGEESKLQTISVIGQHYVMHSYSGSGSVQWFTVLALTDNTEVTIRMPDGAVETYTLNALQSLRYSSV